MRISINSGDSGQGSCLHFIPCCRLRQGLLLALRLHRKTPDLPIVLGTEPFKFLVFGRVQYRLGASILSSLLLTANLLRSHPPLAAVGTELNMVQDRVLEHHSELVGSAPAPSGSFSDAGTTSPCRRQAFL